MPPPSAYVAFLRGINVGGNHKLPMRDLAALFTQAGCQDVQTYIQSGNVVFRAPAELAAQVPVLLQAAMARDFGMQVPVVVRSAAEMREVLAHNPFLHAGHDPATLHVAFLATAPSAAQVASLDPNRSPPDEFVVRGKDVYLRLPDGVARSKLTNAWLDAKLKTVSTARNWRTVERLVAMAAG